MNTLAAKLFLSPSLPLRPGSAPRTSIELPHTQLDQLAPPHMAAELKTYALTLPHVRVRESRVASASTLALWIPESVATGPAEAFIDGHEFCHLHPFPHASLHLTLPSAIRAHALEAGWAQLHPSVEAGYLPQTLVMVYGPRHDEDLKVVLYLLAASHSFATGEYGHEAEGGSE